MRVRVRVAYIIGVGVGRGRARRADSSLPPAPTPPPAPQVSKGVVDDLKAIVSIANEKFHGAAAMAALGGGRGGRPAFPPLTIHPVIFVDPRPALPCPARSLATPPACPPASLPPPPPPASPPALPLPYPRPARTPTHPPQTPAGRVTSSSLVEAKFAKLYDESVVKVCVGVGDPLTTASVYSLHSCISSR